MPIWLRRFTFEKLKEHYSKQNKQKKEENPRPSGPDISPSYITKASGK